MKQLSLSKEARQIIDKAGEFALSHGSSEILALHVLTVMSREYHDILKLLCGKTFSVPEDDPYKLHLPVSKSELKVSDALECIIDDNAADSAVLQGANLLRVDEITPEILGFAIFYEQPQDIADIVLENGLPNDSEAIKNILKNNLLFGLNELIRKSQYVSNAFDNTYASISSSMLKNLPEQKNCILSFLNGWKEMLFDGNGKRPYKVLILSSAECQTKEFVENVRTAFVSERLQDSERRCILDLRNIPGESQADRAYLLGDTRSYRGADSGYLYKATRANYYGMLAFEHLEECWTSTLQVLQSFISNDAVDAFTQTKLPVPKNTILFTMLLDQFVVDNIMESNGGAEISKNELINALTSGGFEHIAKPLSVFFGDMNRIIMLRQPNIKILGKYASDQLDRYGENTGIHFEYDGKGFTDLIIKSVPQYPSRIDIENIVKNFLSKADLHGIRHVLITIDDKIEYPLPETMRINRMEYLTFERSDIRKDKRLEIKISNIKFKRLRSKNEINVSPVRFKDISGWDWIIDTVKQPMCYIKNPEIFAGCPKPPHDFIFVGPPGVGKTYIVQAVSTEAGGWPIFEYCANKVQSTRDLEMMFSEAQKLAPSIIIIDEIDSMQYEQLQSMLRILDGTRKIKNVLVFATTNHPELLDPALLRYGRFKRITFEMPNTEQRKNFVKNYLRKWHVLSEPSFADEISEMTDSMNISDIEGVIAAALIKSRMNGIKLTSTLIRGEIDNFHGERKKRQKIGF